MAKKAKADVATKVLADGLRVGPLRKDQHAALRMHRLLTAQGQRQIDQIVAGQRGRWIDLVLGALEASGVDATDAAQFSAADVVDDEGRVFYEFKKKQAGATSAAAPVDQQQQPAAPAAGE